MRFNKLDLNLLVALDALLTEGSISRAAERVHLSQSAMSNALSRLRDYFNDELLVQVGRKMERTPCAQALADPVRDVLMRVDANIAVRPRFDPRESDREFRIFVSDYTMAVLVPHLLALAAEQSDSIRFQFLPQNDQPQRTLERGEADLLLIPKDYCSPDHPTELLYEERFKCIVWSGSRLAQRGLTLEDYRAAGHVVMQPPGGLPSFEALFMQRQGLARRVAVTTFSFAAVPLLIAHTERVATVHERLAKLSQGKLPLVVFDPPLPIPSMQQVIQWHKYRTNEPGLAWIRDLVKKAALAMDAATS